LLKVLQEGIIIAHQQRVRLLGTLSISARGRYTRRATDLPGVLHVFQLISRRSTVEAIDIAYTMPHCSGHSHVSGWLVSRMTTARYTILRRPRSQHELGFRAVFRITARPSRKDRKQANDTLTFLSGLVAEPARSCTIYPSPRPRRCL